MDKHSKVELTKAARILGWTGDEARCTKESLARFVASNNSTDQCVDASPVEDVPQPQPVPPTVPTVPTVTEDVPQPRSLVRKDDGAIAGAVAKGIADALSGLRLGIDEDAVRELKDERLRAVEPAKIVLNGDAAPVVLDEHTHPMFEKVLRLVRSGVNVYLIGPAGCGKSYLGKQVAKALGYKFGTIHCSAGASESQVTGWLLPVGKGGEFKFVPSQFAVLYAEGKSVFLIDEIDRADANMLVVLNGALANGALHIPQCPDRPEWVRGDNTAIIAAGNTYGMGADMLYSAAGQLDAATMDRFYIVHMDYDKHLEHKLAGLPYVPAAPWQAADAPTSQELQQLAQWVMDLRDKLESTNGTLRRVIGTRTVQKAIAARGAGVPTVEVKADILAG